MYTYSQNDHPIDRWQAKIASSLHNSYQNNNMRYGTNTEEKALRVFQEKTDGNLYRAGLIINKHLPCFGFSPDAFLLKNGKISVVEVKCPVAGTTETLDKMLSSCSYLRNVGGKFEVRKKHQYYGQMQLGLFLTNCENCHFVLYNKTENRNYVTIVKADKLFQKNLITNLVKVYLSYYLPHLKHNYRSL